MREIFYFAFDISLAMTTDDALSQLLSSGLSLGDYLFIFIICTAQSQYFHQALARDYIAKH